MEGGFSQKEPPLLPWTPSHGSGLRTDAGTLSRTASPCNLGGPDLPGPRPYPLRSRNLEASCLVPAALLRTASRHLLLPPAKYTPVSIWRPCGSSKGLLIAKERVAPWTRCSCVKQKRSCALMPHHLRNPLRVPCPEFAGYRHLGQPNSSVALLPANDDNNIHTTSNRDGTDEGICSCRDGGHPRNRAGGMCRWVSSPAGRREGPPPPSVPERTSLRTNAQSTNSLSDSFPSTHLPAIRAHLDALLRAWVTDTCRHRRTPCRCSVCPQPQPVPTPSPPVPAGAPVSVAPQGWRSSAPACAEGAARQLLLRVAPALPLQTELARVTCEWDCTTQPSHLPA